MYEKLGLKHWLICAVVVVAFTAQTAYGDHISFYSYPNGTYCYCYKSYGNGSYPWYGNETYPWYGNETYPWYGNETYTMYPNGSYPWYGNETYTMYPNGSYPWYGNETYTMYPNGSYPWYGNKTYTMYPNGSYPWYGNETYTMYPNGSYPWYGNESYTTMYPNGSYPWYGNASCTWYIYSFYSWYANDSDCYCYSINDTCVNYPESQATQSYEATTTTSVLGPGYSTTTPPNTYLNGTMCHCIDINWNFTDTWYNRTGDNTTWPTTTHTIYNSSYTPPHWYGNESDWYGNNSDWNMTWYGNASGYSTTTNMYSNMSYTFPSFHWYWYWSDNGSYCFCIVFGTTDSSPPPEDTTTTATLPPTTTVTLPPTTTTAGYEWTEPTAWSSDRLYLWGSVAGDTDLMEAEEHWSKYYICPGIALNGKAGSVFFNKRHYVIHICNNGILSLDLEWTPYYPYSFGINYWYNKWSLLAPFWGRGDELTMSLLSDDWPQARTQIYYQVYQRAATMNDQTMAVLDRAEQDVAASTQGVADFKPSWVLVVTWINLAGDVGCRWPSMYEKVYSDYYWYDDYYTEYLEECKLAAEQYPVNHFQAVYITDGVYTFIKYNYPEDGINWVYPGIGPDDSTAVYSSAQNLYGTATGGYQAPSATGSVNYTNLWSSGTLDFIDIDNRAGNMNDSRVGEWLFRVEESNGDVDARVQCNQWVATQDQDYYETFNNESHCPQNLWQAWWDTSFRTHSYQFNSRFNSWCLQAVFPDVSFGLKQRCCYDLNWGADSFSTLITEFPFHSHVHDPRDVADEEDGYKKCCVYSTGSCKEFYKVRPVNDGRYYVPPAIRPWFGDPHIITSDGFSYTFNGQGEYLFTKIGDNDTIIQARTERVVLSDGALGQATYFSAICIATVGLPNVQVQINKSPADDLLVNTTQLIVNGSLVDFSVIEQDANTTQSIDGISSDIQFERSNDTLTVLFSSGVSIAVTPANGMLTITLGLPSRVKGSTIGLTGTFDDNQENDLSYLNRTYISIDSSESEIFDWAETFAISEEDSLMYYMDNTNWYTYNNNSFVPVFIDNIANWAWFNETFKTAAYDLCVNDTACLYDVFITGDLSIGASSKKTAEDSEAASAQLNNFAPTISGPNSVLVTAGQFVYMMTVNDSNGDAITVTTNISSTITVNGDEVTIAGTITNTDNFIFTIIAKDTFGVSSSKTLLTMFCDCANNGTCVELTEQQHADVETNSVTLDCICPTGYTGDLCDTDLDACELVASPCYPSVLCVDSPAPADHEGYTCGDCPAGYTGDGKTCNDVDECVGNVCDHICINSPGSFVCACRTGYSLNADSSTCDDIDECLTDTCHQVCNNTDGSYTCTCDPGFVLSSDNVNCEPANPCAEPHPCDVTNGLCNLEGGLELCSCTKGYQLTDNGTTCEDVNECTMNTHTCVQDCINTDGGYNCSCQSGYTLASNGIDCDDINECTAGGSNCLTSQICINNVGGYSCECPGSSVLINGQCTVLLTTSPVAEIVDSPGTEAEINSVLFSLQGMTIAEYTVEKETSLFTLLAKSANELCSSATCDLVSTPSEARRRKRSTPSVTFYKEHFSRLPGYPQYDSNGDLELAIYTLVPGSGVLSNQLLKQVVEDVSLNISAVLGANVINLAIMTTTTVGPSTSAPTTTEAQTTEAQTTEAQTTEGVTEPPKDLTAVYIAVACCGGLVLLTLIIILVVCKVKKGNGNSKSVHPADTQPTNIDVQPVEQV